MFSHIPKLFSLCVLCIYSIHAYSDVHKLAYSKNMGVTVFADGAPDWCKEELKLIVDANKDSFFASSDFEKLIGAIGEKILPDECSSANRVLVTGKYDQNVLWQGFADKKSGWQVVSQNLENDGFSNVLASRAKVICAGQSVECSRVLEATASAWLNEALEQSLESQSARRRFEMLFSNPGALSDDTVRLELFQEALEDETFTGELSNKLNNEFLAREDIGLPKMDAKAIKNIASDIAVDIITDMAVESLARDLEQSGDKKKAYWIRTAAKPSIEIVTLAKGLAAGTTTVSGAAVGTGVIWGKNLYSFTLLGVRLNEDDATGQDVQSKLDMLAKQDASMVESLISGETRGELYRGYKTRKLTQKEIDALQDMLITNNEHQVELLKQKAVYDEFAWVVDGAKKFAKLVASIDAGATYSGLEHANSTPSLPKDSVMLPEVDKSIEDASARKLADDCKVTNIGACKICNPAQSGLFRPIANSPINGEAVYRYKWSGGCGDVGQLLHKDNIDQKESAGVVNTTGTLTVYLNDKDYFELNASEKTGVKYIDGKPIVQLPENAFAVYLSSGKKLMKNGECPTPRVLRTWVVTNPDLALHADIVAKAVINGAHAEVIKRCPSLRRMGRSVTIVVPTDVVSDFGGIEESVSKMVDGHSPIRKVLCEGGSTFTIESSCDSRYINYEQKVHIRTMAARYHAKIAAQKKEEQARKVAAHQRALAAEKEKIRKLRVAAEEKWKSKWDAELDSDEAWDNLTDLMRYNKAETIAKLSKGHLVRLEYKDKNVEFAQGESVLKDYHRGTDIYEGIPKGRFSWANWFDTINTVGSNRSFTVYCKVDADALVGLNEDLQYAFHGKLVSVDDSNYVSRIVLDCKRSDDIGNNEPRPALYP